MSKIPMEKDNAPRSSSGPSCSKTTSLFDYDRYFDVSYKYPVGYRFQPSDEEVILNYLKNKIEGRKLPPCKMTDVNFYMFKPEDLAANNEPYGDETTWYFFTSRDRKYKNGNRPDRDAGDGFWKAKGKEIDIVSNDRKIGSKKHLVFNRKTPDDVFATEWNMHEFIYEYSTQRRQRNGENNMKLDDWVLCRMYKNKGFGKRIKSREDKGITQNGSNRVQTFPPEKKMRNKKKKNNNNKTTPSIDHNQERKEGGISDSNINNNNNNNNGTNFPSTSKQQAIDQHNMVSEDFSTIISSGNENVAAPTGLSSNTPGAITTPATLTGLSSNISGAITTPGALTGLSSNTSGSSTIPAASGDNRLHPERVSQRDEPYHQMTTQQNDNDIELMKVYGELPPLTEVRPSNNIDDDLYFKLERIIGDEFPSSREAFLQDGDPTWPWPPPSCSGK